MNSKQPRSGDELDITLSRKRQRRTTSPSRATLSCTECNKQGTECINTGSTPCPACVLRETPNQCQWAPEKQAADPSALATEVDMLRDQVTMLYDIIYQDPQGYARLQGLGDGSSSSSAKKAQPSASYPLNQFLDRYPPNKNIFQHEQGTVAPRATSLNEARGSSASRTGEIHSPNTNNPLAPCGPSPFASMWPSRIPRIFDPVVRKTCLHNHVFGMLPDPAVARKLSKAYLEGPFHRGWPIVHTPSFRQEEAAFFALPPNVQRVSTDPAWIALYMMILGLGIKALSSDEALSLLTEYHSEEISRLPRAFYHASVLALEVANVDVIPQIRHIQVSLIYIAYLFHLGPGAEDRNPAKRHLMAAIMSAESLGLNELGNDANKAPLRDPAFSNLSANVAFEMSKRLYHLVLFKSCTSWKRRKMYRLMAVEHTTNASSTERPLNVNDDDLLQSDLSERPLTEWTNASLSRIGSAYGLQVQAFIKANSAGEAPYEDCLKHSEGLSATLQQVPSPFVATDRGIDWMHICLYCSINHRLVRIHRPYMARSYTDPKYAQSSIISVESARNIIAAQRLLLGWPNLRPWFCKLWILAAALALSVDLAISIDMLHSREIFASKRLQVSDALQIIRQEPVVDKIPPLTEQGFKIIEGLLAAADRAMALRETQPTVSPSGDLHNFFDDLSSAVSGTLPPPQSQTSPAFNLLDFLGPEVAQGQLEDDGQLQFDFSTFDGWDSLDTNGI